VSDSKILRFLRIYLFCVGRNINYFVLEFCRTVEYIILSIQDFFPKFFETSKCQISENSKTGSMEPVLQTDFLVFITCTLIFSTIIFYILVHIYQRVQHEDVSLIHII
jgi:hypothetical protein